MPSSPYTAYGWQPAPTRGPARPAAPVYPFKPLASTPARKYAPYTPARKPTSGRAVLIVLGVLVGLPVALVAVVCAIAAGAITAPLVAGVLLALAIFRPKRNRPRAQAPPRRTRRR